MNDVGYTVTTQRWYHSARWDRLRSHQLREHPLCAMCLKEGKIEGARIVDHIIPHEGDVNKFWLGKLQSLCINHHNKSKQQMETRGYAGDIGEDGFPSDPQHPFNLASSKRRTL